MERYKTTRDITKDKQVEDRGGNDYINIYFDTISKYGETLLNKIKFITV